jgi:hypothetical protein
MFGFGEQQVRGTMLDKLLDQREMSVIQALEAKPAKPAQWDQLVHKAMEVLKEM